jgi:hypothetical protein
MRNYCEPTARNLLRRPHVFGVPLFGLIALACFGLMMSIALSGFAYGDLIALGASLIAYLVLRIVNRFSKTGWQESMLWPVERRIRVKNPTGQLVLSDAVMEIAPPDTLDERELIAAKDALLERIVSLKEKERFTLVCEISQKGAQVLEASVSGKFNLAGELDFWELTQGIFGGEEEVYTLWQIPVQTDPLFLFSILKRIETPVTVVVTVSGVS